MDKIKEAIASLKKPIEAALRDPSRIEHLGEIEKSIAGTLDNLSDGRPFRFSVEMLIWDLRNELRGFERFDGPNKSALIENCYRILSRLEGFTEREETIFLQESEIAAEMKEQAAREVAEQARRAQRARRDARSRPAPKPEADDASAAPAKPDRGNGPAAAARPADDESKPKPSRRRRRSRRKRKPKTNNDN